MFRTETRVATTDPASRRRFRRYWTVFSAGILLIRFGGAPAGAAGGGPHGSRRRAAGPGRAPPDAVAGYPGVAGPFRSDSAHRGRDRRAGVGHAARAREAAVASDVVDAGPPAAQRFAAAASGPGIVNPAGAGPLIIQGVP